MFCFLFVRLWHVIHLRFHVPYSLFLKTNKKFLDTFILCILFGCENVNADKKKENKYFNPQPSFSYDLIDALCT